MKTEGTLKELGKEIVKAFQRLTAEEQEQLRKTWYEKVTGKPYAWPVKTRGLLMIAKLTKSEFDEVMDWRIARMKEAGTLPSFEEVAKAITKARVELPEKLKEERKAKR